MANKWDERKKAQEDEYFVKKSESWSRNSKPNKTPRPKSPSKTHPT